MFQLLKNLFSSESVDLNAVLERGAVIVDVRMPSEYQGGHIKKSKNIPLPNLNKEVQKLKKLNKPVITCCASGMRSQKALSVLKSQGIEAYNGGGWKQLQNIMKK